MLRSTASKLFLQRTFCTAAAPYGFETLKVSPRDDAVFEVALNRPQKGNAMNQTFWREITECFDQLGADPDCRVVVLSGEGKHFSAGIDLEDHVELFAGSGEDVSRRAFKLREHIKRYQDSFTAVERCPKPVIAAIHGACVGGAVDLVCAADMRYCSSDAWFCVKEVDIGIAADVGTLQRLPRIIGNDSLMRELAYTARNMPAEEALRHGLVSAVLPDRPSLMAHADTMARTIAEKSPVAVQGTKLNMNYSRDHTIAEGLEFAANWNMVMLQSPDLMEAAESHMTQKKPNFSKL